MLNSCFAHVMYLFLFFSFHHLNLELGLHLFLSCFKKSYRLGGFYACDNTLEHWETISTTPKLNKKTLQLN